MIIKGYYIKQKVKLVKRLKKTLKRYDKKITAQFGAEYSQTIQKEALVYYEKLIPDIPHYDAASYQSIILVNAQIIAIMRAMKKQGKTVEETLKIQVELWKEDYRKIPSFVGRVFVSRFGGYF